MDCHQTDLAALKKFLLYIRIVDVQERIAVKDEKRSTPEDRQRSLEGAPSAQEAGPVGHVLDPKAKIRSVPQKLLNLLSEISYADHDSLDVVLSKELDLMLDEGPSGYFDKRLGDSL
jgi:hypothetical protein